MAITFTFGTIKLSNVTAVRTEINRIRAKHGLAAFGFAATDAWPRATTMVELKTQISRIDQSPWIAVDSINVTTIPTFTIGLSVKETDFSSMGTVLNTVDAICAYNANNANYSNYSNWNDDNYDGHNSNYSNNTVDDYCPGHC